MNQPYTPLPPATRTSTTALISLIAGILGFFQILPIIGPIIAVITGHMAKNEIKNSVGMVTGNGLATAGLILGYVVIGLGLCACLVGVILVIAGVISIPYFNTTSH